MKQNLLGLDAEGLARWFEALGEKPFRARQVLRWIHQLGVADFAAMSDLSRDLRAKLAQSACVEPPRLVGETPAADGTRKWLVKVDGANAVESVFIPESGRATLCVSSQAGCVLDCSFCATGKQGFNRNLGTAEIVGQLWHANKILGVERKTDRIISNVVFRGMGEPMLNLDNVIPALRLMLDDNAYGLSRRRVTVSTSGVIPGMDRLRDACPVALAVSLHAPNDALRDRLVPINRKYPLRDLVAACKRYLEKAPRDFITFEYVMLDGVNDADAHARQLAGIAAQVRCKFNLIPFNPFPQSGFRRSGAERIARFAEILRREGLTVTTRKTRGDDIAAACGQRLPAAGPLPRATVLAILVAALGYFVDIYDLILFSVIRVPSLTALGLQGERQVDRRGGLAHPALAGGHGDGILDALQGLDPLLHGMRGDPGGDVHVHGGNTQRFQGGGDCLRQVRMIPAGRITELQIEDDPAVLDIDVPNGPRGNQIPVEIHVADAGQQTFYLFTFDFGHGNAGFAGKIRTYLTVFSRSVSGLRGPLYGSRHSCKLASNDSNPMI